MGPVAAPSSANHSGLSARIRRAKAASSPSVTRYSLIRRAQAPRTRSSGSSYGTGGSLTVTSSLNHLYVSLDNFGRCGSQGALWRPPDTISPEVRNEHASEPAVGAFRDHHRAAHYGMVGRSLTCQLGLISTQSDGNDKDCQQRVLSNL